MAARRWSRAQVENLVRGRTLYLRDVNAATAEGPAWLRAAAGEVSALDSAQCLAVTHPEDQSELYGSFIASVERPGELCGAHLRIFLDGRWSHHEIQWLNLLDHPDVGVNLCVEWEVTGPPVATPEGVEASGYHHEGNWVLLDLDAGAVITAVTGRLTATLGYDAPDVIGRPASNFLHPDSVGPAVVHWLALRDDPGGARPTLRRWVRGDGSEVVLESAYLNAGGTPDGGVRLLLHDVTDRLRDEEELTRSRHELEALADELGELADDVARLADEVPFPVFRCDAHGTVRFHNARWAERVPATVTSLHELIDAAGAQSLEAALAVPRAGGEPTVGVRAADGIEVWRLHLQRTLGADEDDIVGAVEDVTATVELRQQAEHDPLTALASRALTEQRLAHAVATD